MRVHGNGRAEYGQNDSDTREINGQGMEQEMSGKRVEVRAKMAGVFYRSPGPDEPTYAEVGDEVKKKQVLALLETMKVFQKVKSPAAGKIVEIIPENETPLMDNDLMFVIES